MTDNLNIPVPLDIGDLIVLEWYAAWTPKVHEADWKVRRSWPPGFRVMEDLSCPGFADRDNTVANAGMKMSAGPLLRGDTTATRSGAKSRLPRLLSYRLIEGTAWGASRLTARGRAALKVHGRECPDFFKSHCPKIFDDHNLLPINGVNVRLDFDDKIMRRLPEGYQVGHREALPDDKTTWDLLLREYSEDSYRGNRTLTGASAHLSICSTTGMYLNGSLRNHHQVVTLNVQDEGSSRHVFECSLSLEGLADLLVSNGHVPVTLGYFVGTDGMAYSRPAPPPVSVTRRMQERIARGTQDIQNRVAQAAAMLDAAKMGKRAKDEILDLLGLVARDVPTHGAFAAQQAMEEVSAVAESMMTVMSEKAQLAGQGASALRIGGRAPSTALLLESEGSSIEDSE